MVAFDVEMKCEKEILGVDLRINRSRVEKIVRHRVVENGNVIIPKDAATRHERIQYKDALGEQHREIVERCTPIFDDAALKIIATIRKSWAVDDGSVLPNVAIVESRRAVSCRYAGWFPDISCVESNGPHHITGKIIHGEARATIDRAVAVMMMPVVAMYDMIGYRGTDPVTADERSRLGMLDCRQKMVESAAHAAAMRIMVEIKHHIDAANDAAFREIADVIGVDYDSERYA